MSRLLEKTAHLLVSVDQIMRTPGDSYEMRVRTLCSRAVLSMARWVIALRERDLRLYDDLMGLGFDVREAWSHADHYGTLLGKSSFALFPGEWTSEELAELREAIVRRDLVCECDDSLRRIHEQNYLTLMELFDLLGCGAIGEIMTTEVYRLSKDVASEYSRGFLMHVLRDWCWSQKSRGGEVSKSLIHNSFLIFLFNEIEIH